MLCEFTSRCPCEAPGCKTNLSKHLTLLLGLLPNRMSFSPGQPSSHQPLTSSFPTSDPRLLHAPILFCREKEGNVWAPCLLLGVSSDGFNHPWVPSSSYPQSLPFSSFFQALFHLIPLCLFSFFRDVAPAMLVFYLCLCLWEWVGSVAVKRSEQNRWISRGPFFSTICLWWTWMSSLVCKLLSFGWMPIPLTWMHFYIAYIVISSSHLVWSCVSGVLCRNR